MKIALIGNPNSGKTTLFNAITGKIEYVGNWPGVTVAKKEGRIKTSLNPGKEDLIAVDLPGAYSMSPYTCEECITSNFVLDAAPDVIINIVDSTNLSRSLFFTSQLLELGIPVVVALNKIDMTEEKGNVIKTDLLSARLRCPVVEITATKTRTNGLKQLVATTVKHGKGGVQKAPIRLGLQEIQSKRDFKKADRKRFEFVENIVAEVERKKISPKQQTRQDKLDRIVAHKWLGVLIFAVVIWFIFWISQATLGPLLADIFVGWLEIFQGWVAGLLTNVHPVISALLVDGILGGVIAVVGFLPLIMIMFFLMALFEDSGYMARAAIVMDRFFKKVGLSGRSVIPMVMGTACAIPAVMATRTIKNQRQRRTTAMLAPFMPCGAKLPIIALFAGVFFSDNAWVGTSMYLLGIAVILFSALIIRKITGDESVSYFIMELPEYKIPSAKRALFSTLSRARAFVVKAGTVILVCNAIVHILQTFNWNFQVVAETAADTSILASLARPFALIFIPLGFGIWQFAAAAITGLVAKENVVGTLAVTFGISNFINLENFELVGGAAGVSAAFSIGSVAALSFLVFNLFSPPCFAAIAAIRAEVDSAKWTWGAVAFQLSMGYSLSFFIYQIGTLITEKRLGTGFVPGLIAVLVIISIIAVLMYRGSKEKSLVKATQKVGS
ncbi:MAG: ferrous iron transport protein B [Fastidiosipila sp.]|nr:ferrous iron transport protein B [Fastidiosipila sp.]